MKQKLTFLALVLFVLAGCAVTPATTPPAPENSAPISLENTEWRLASFGANGQESPVIPGTDLTLQFGTEGVVSGTGGCNSFGGKYTVENNRLILSGINSTLRACLDETANQQEQRYLEALQTTGQIQMAGDQLKVQYDDGNSVMTFNRATASAAPGWVRQAFNGTWDISYPQGWSVSTDDLEQGYVELSGKYGAHHYIVRLSHPATVTQSSLDRWVEDELASLLPNELARTSSTDITIGSAFARRISWVSVAEEAHPIELVYVWRTSGRSPRLISISQADTQEFDPQALAEFADRFLTAVG